MEKQCRDRPHQARADQVEEESQEPCPRIHPLQETVPARRLLGNREREKKEEISCRDLSRWFLPTGRRPRARAASSLRSRAFVIASFVIFASPSERADILPCRTPQGRRSPKRKERLRRSEVALSRYCVLRQGLSTCRTPFHPAGAYPIISFTSRSPFPPGGARLQYVRKVEPGGGEHGEDQQGDPKIPNLFHRPASPGDAWRIHADWDRCR
jgi:hypothetical protein